MLDCLPDKAAAAGDAELTALCDDKPQKFIVNFIREYGDIEYVNIGRVTGSLSRRPTFSGRRGVYIAVVRLRDSDCEMVKIIRMQKYAVREYLNEGRSLLDAILQSEEYTEYILDRRLGCRQLGMNLPVRTVARRLSETYTFPDGGSRVIYSPYFERDYISGIATDKTPPGGSRRRSSPSASPACSDGSRPRTSSWAAATSRETPSSTTATRC